MNDEWTDITEHFDPAEDLKDILSALGYCRIVVANGDGLYTFLDQEKQIRHAVYWLATKWVCPCPAKQPCAAVLLLQVTSFNWNVTPRHTPDEWEARSRGT